MFSKELKLALEVAAQNSNPDLWVQSHHLNAGLPPRALEAGPLAVALQNLPWTNPDSPHFRVPGDLPSGILYCHPGPGQATVAPLGGLETVPSAPETLPS